MTPSWRRRGSLPPAPPHIKRRIVAGIVRATGVGVFVETGTYRGDTLAHVHPLVRLSYSIELDPRLARLARHRFRNKPDVEILEGDSAVVLPEVMASISEPALFWLDGHFSAGVTARGDAVTPIERELALVLERSRPPHVVLIDDARLFTGRDGYPELGQIEDAVHALRPTWHVEVSDDIVRVQPPAGESALRRLIDPCEDADSAEPAES